MAIRNVGAGGNVVGSAPATEVDPAPKSTATNPPPQQHKRWGSGTKLPERAWRPAAADPGVAKEIEKLKGSLVDKNNPNDRMMRGSQRLLDSLISPSIAADVLRHGIKDPGGNRFAADKIPGLRQMLTRVAKGQPVSSSELKEMAGKVKDKMFTTKLFWANFNTNMKQMQEKAHAEQLAAAKKGGK